MKKRPLKLLGKYKKINKELLVDINKSIKDIIKGNIKEI